MKTFAKVLSLIFLLSFANLAKSQDHHVRIGFIGNSITIGSFLSDPVNECYPSQVALLLKEKYGDTCVVTNYAVSGRTMLKKGDYPIWKEASFKNCVNAAPNICFICLGTNDSKPYNWDVYGKEFYDNYKSMIDTFKMRNPYTKFIVCYPAPAFAVVYDIRGEIIRDKILPIVDSIVKYSGAELVDFYHPLVDSVSLFPDKIHPSARGAKVFAKIVYDKIISSDIVHKAKIGYTNVTSLQMSAPSKFRQKDTITLSWTTLNANEAFLNGKKVGLEGSIKTPVFANTSFTVIAKGAVNSDSITVWAKPYVPILSYLYLNASQKEFEKGDTITLKPLLSDQNRRDILDSVFNVEYTVTEGSGFFVNKNGNEIDFVATSTGTVKVLCTIGSLTREKILTVSESPVSLNYNSKSCNFSIWPNPVKQKAEFSFYAAKPFVASIKIYDINGRLCISEQRSIVIGQQKVELNTSGLTKGFYSFRFETGDKTYSGKLIKVD
jgi:lysophospholipase L1-like esterase